MTKGGEIQDVMFYVHLRTARLFKRFNSRIFEHTLFEKYAKVLQRKPREKIMFLFHFYPLSTHLTCIKLFSPYNYNSSHSFKPIYAECHKFQSGLDAKNLL